jgi:copper(I)-binding protein
VAAAGDLAVYDACAPAAAAPDVGSLYFTVVNGGNEPDTLLGVASPAGTAMLHDVITEGELTSMVHVPTVEIAPHGTLALAPGSYHVMLSNLGEPLRLGDTVSVTLTFARAGQVRFVAPVLTYTGVVELLERRPEP